MAANLTNPRQHIEAMLYRAGYSHVEWDDTHFWQSVKTLTDRGVVDGTPFFVKIASPRRKQVIPIQGATYAQLSAALPCDRRLRVPEVLLCDSQNGILVTEEATGKLMTKCLLAALTNPSMTYRLSALSHRIGESLALVHNRMPINEDRQLQLYLDFSPQNLFFDWGANQITLIDPPERIEFGPRERDLAVATVEIIRQLLQHWKGLNPKLWRSCRNSVVAGYEQEAGQSVDVDRLKLYESAHVDHLISANHYRLKLKHSFSTTAMALPRMVLNSALLQGLHYLHRSQTPNR